MNFVDMSFEITMLLKSRCLLNHDTSTVEISTVSELGTYCFPCLFILHKAYLNFNEMKVFHLKSLFRGALLSLCLGLLSIPSASAERVLSSEQEMMQSLRSFYTT